MTASGRAGGTIAGSSRPFASDIIATLVSAEVDPVQALTFNNVPEAVGVAQAAARLGLAASISFILDGPERLAAGPSLREAIEVVDELTGDERPAFCGVNCVHPDEFAGALEDAEWFQRVRSLRPNAVMADKVALCSLGHLEAGDPVASAPPWANSRASTRTSTSGSVAAAPGTPASTRSPATSSAPGPLRSSPSRAGRSGRAPGPPRSAGRTPSREGHCSPPPRIDKSDTPRFRQAVWQVRSPPTHVARSGRAGPIGAAHGS